MKKIPQIYMVVLGILAILLGFCCIIAELESKEYQGLQTEEDAIIEKWEKEIIPEITIRRFVYDDETTRRFAEVDPNDKSPEEQKE